MRSIHKVSILAAALLALGACVEDDSSTDRDKAPTPTAKTTSTVKSTAAAKAHHGKMKHADPVAHAKKLGEKLNLSTEQQSKVEAIFKSDITWPERHKQIRALLSTEQQAKLAELKAKHPHHSKNKHHMFDPAKKADWYAKHLGLSADQKTRVLGVLKTKGTWDQRHKQINAVLTPAQQTKLAEFKAKHHSKKGMHHKFDPAKKAAWLQEKLGLTDTQKAGLVTAFKASSMKAKHAALRKILTADQLTELKRLHKDKKSGHGCDGSGCDAHGSKGHSCEGGGCGGAGAGCMHGKKGKDGKGMKHHKGMKHSGMKH